MEWNRLSGKLAEYISKYRYVALVLLFGIILMSIPQKKEKVEPTVISQDTEVEEQTLEKQLEDILSQLSGAGKVRVLLTVSEGEKTVFQTDENRMDGAGLRSETVILTDAQRSQGGMITQVNPPTYKGAIVLCQGADKAAVKLAITEAVSNVTGLTYDKITVLKSK